MKADFDLIIEPVVPMLPGCMAYSAGWNGRVMLNREYAKTKNRPLPHKATKSQRKSIYSFC